MSAAAGAPAPRPSSNSNSSSSSSSYTATSSSYSGTYESATAARVRAENDRIERDLQEEKLRAFTKGTQGLPFDVMTPQEKLDLLERYRKSDPPKDESAALSYLAGQYRTEKQKFDGEVRTEKDRLTTEVLPALARQGGGPAFERLTAFER